MEIVHHRVEVVEVLLRQEKIQHHVRQAQQVLEVLV
jgi:hypothetical protein